MKMNFCIKTICCFFISFASSVSAFSTEQAKDSYTQFDYSRSSAKTISIYSKGTDELIGSIVFHVDGNLGHIDRIHVSPDFRGYRIGQTLFQWAIQDMQKQYGAQNIQWEAYPFEVAYQRDDISSLQERQAALDRLVSFYQALGAVVVGMDVISGYRVLAMMCMGRLR